jgi:hypothetical protein
VAKILVSSEFGAGWSTWHSGPKEEREFFLRFQPLIDALEAGEDIGYVDGLKPPKPGSALAKFLAEFEVLFPASAGSLYLGGARDLEVLEVHGPFRVDEYDGSENVVNISIEEYYCFDEEPKQLERGDEIDGEAEEIIV